LIALSFQVLQFGAPEMAFVVASVAQKYDGDLPVQAGADNGGTELDVLL
jgi:hypothetical protein